MAVYVQLVPEVPAVTASVPPLPTAILDALPIPVKVLTFSHFTVYGIDLPSVSPLRQEVMRSWRDMDVAGKTV